VAELRVGIQLARGGRRGKRARFVAAILDAVAVEAYDPDVADAHAALLTHVRRTGTPRGAHDLIIAATARARRRQVVTLDRRAFANLPQVTVAADGSWPAVGSPAARTRSDRDGDREGEDPDRGAEEEGVAEGED
jgi:predicted nucleic acid-binding protein